MCTAVEGRGQETRSHSRLHFTLLLLTSEGTGRCYCVVCGGGRRDWDPGQQSQDERLQRGSEGTMAPSMEAVPHPPPPREQGRSVSARVRSYRQAGWDGAPHMAEFRVHPPHRGPLTLVPLFLGGSTCNSAA